ncbi:alpha-amylase family glycosyl hydrolase [soil metagenome]
MGAIAHNDGVTFRVWAPNARQVAVTGEFSSWDPAHKRHLTRDNARSGTWSVFVPGVATGAPYRFLIRTGGPYRARIDPVARQVTHSDGDAVVFDPRALVGDFEGAAPFTMPPWDDLVIYEVHIPTFAAQGWRAGTFDRAIGRLDHLVWLGVNAIEVMPPFAFGGSVSWGYNPAHPYAIEPSYGGPHAFARFVQAAHARGIAVILDVVYNHLGPGDLHLWRFDGGRNRRYGGSYFYNDRRALTPWGATRPNYERKQVRNYLRDSAVMWLEDFRVDGLRFDATQFIRSRSGNVGHHGDRIAAGHRFLASMTADIRSRQPWKILIAEDMQGDPVVTHPSDHGGLGFSSQWDAGFVHPVRAALEAVRDEDRDLYAVARAVTGHAVGAPHERVIYTESHDEVANGRNRVPESVFPGQADSWPARTRAALGLVLTFTSPGIPMLFQGQDMLEDRWFDDTTPVDWSKSHRHAGFLHLTRQLIALRRNGTGLTRGLGGPHTRVIRVDNDAKVLAFHRWSRGGPRDDTVVLVNLRTTPVRHYPVGLPRQGRWKLRCNTDSAMFGPGLGSVHAGDLTAEPHECDGYPHGAHVTIGPYAAVIYSQDG